MIVVQHKMSLASLGQTFEARASEWFLTGATLTLSLVFLLNIQTFYSEAFEGLRSINNNRFFWAFVLIAVGAIGTTVLTINGSYYRTPHFRCLVAFLRAGVWFLMCLGFARNGSVLIALVPWIFALDAYNTYRAAKEAGKSEFGHRYEIRLKQDLANGRAIGSHT